MPSHHIAPHRPTLHSILHYPFPCVSLSLCRSTSVSLTLPLHLSAPLSLYLSLPPYLFLRVRASIWLAIGGTTLADNLRDAQRLFRRCSSGRSAPCRATTPRRTNSPTPPTTQMVSSECLPASLVPRSYRALPGRRGPGASSIFNPNQTPLPPGQSPFQSSNPPSSSSSSSSSYRSSLQLSQLQLSQLQSLSPLPHLLVFRLLLFLTLLSHPPSLSPCFCQGWLCPSSHLRESKFLSSPNWRQTSARPANRSARTCSNSERASLDDVRTRNAVMIWSWTAPQVTKFACWYPIPCK